MDIDSDDECTNLWINRAACARCGGRMHVLRAVYCEMLIALWPDETYPWTHRRQCAQAIQESYANWGGRDVANEIMDMEREDLHPMTGSTCPIAKMAHAVYKAQVSSTMQQRTRALIDLFLLASRLV